MELLSQKQRQKIIAKTKNMRMFLKNPIFNIIFFETLGTLILAFGISVTEYVHPISRHIINPFWTFLISCFNFLAISVSGPFSGGHVNSSVTVGLYAGKIVQGRRVLPYVLSQIGGAILGTLLYYAFFRDTPQIYRKTPEFSEILYDGISEAIGTMIFVFSIIYVDSRKYMKGEPFKYFFISLMLLVGRMFTFRKGCLNPAIAIAFQIFSASMNHNFALFYSCFGIIIGSLIGGVLGAIFYNKFYNPLLSEIDKYQIEQ